jgi:hypothetical protein
MKNDLFKFHNKIFNASCFDQTFNANKITSFNSPDPYNFVMLVILIKLLMRRKLHHLIPLIHIMDMIKVHFQVVIYLLHVKYEES